MVVTGSLWKIRLSTALGLVLASAALGGCESSGDGGDDSTAKPVAAIQTAIAGLGSVSQQAPLYGTAEPASGADGAITVPIEANVGRLLVTSGTRVRAGQVIAVLSASTASRLDIARAGVDASTTAAAFARAQRLRADGLMSDADLEAAQSAARAAALTRDSLAGRVGRLALRAPFAGSVEGLTAREGDLIAMGTTLARVVSGDHLRARFGIDPVLARRAHAGMPITVTLSTSGTSLTTTVQSVDPVIDPATRQASLIAALPPGGAISPGEIVKATVEIAGTGSTVTIPYAALLDDGGESYVFVIDKEVAHRRAVTVGQAQGNVVAIASGLKAGERVAVSGGTALDEGMKVRDTGATAVK
jgi:RND family efflux transporter MFP subunit